MTTPTNPLGLCQDALCLEFKTTREHRAMSDEQFYQQYPELEALDNGEGFFTNASNGDVEMSEFLQFGRDVLRLRGYQSPGDHLVAETATEGLTAALRRHSNAFARYYIGEVLDPEVGRAYLATGGMQFFLPNFPVHLTVSGYRLPIQSDNDTCASDNRVTVTAGHIRTHSANDGGTGGSCEFYDADYGAYPYLRESRGEYGSVDLCLKGRNAGPADPACLRSKQRLHDHHAIPREYGLRRHLMAAYYQLVDQQPHAALQLFVVEEYLNLQFYDN